MPQSGWTFIASDDLGDLIGNCEFCGTVLRYVFAIEHSTWGAMAVGTDCCDRLTITTQANEYQKRYLKLVDMRKRFIGSPKWKVTPSGLMMIKRSGIPAFIVPNGTKFRIGFGGVQGKVDYDSTFDAKLKIFDFIESGEATAFLEKRRANDIAKMRRRQNLPPPGGNGIRPPE